MVKNALAAGAPNWIPLGELTALPDPLDGLREEEVNGGTREKVKWTVPSYPMGPEGPGPQATGAPKQPMR